MSLRKVEKGHVVDRAFSLEYLQVTAVPDVMAYIWGGEGEYHEAVGE
jgi:hypothetical protein